MKVLSISTDRNIFKKESAVRARILEYGNLFEELHLVIFSKARSFKKEQIASNVWIYPTNSWTKWRYIENAIKIASRVMRERNFESANDVITVQDPFETGVVGAKLKKNFKIKLHVQIHTDFLSPYFAKHSFLNKIRVRIAKEVLRKADAVRVVSSRIKSSLEKNKITNAPVSVIPVFVDIKAISETSPKMDLLKKYPQFNFIILVASRFTKEKNIPLALEVLKSLVKINPRSGLVIVGQGPEKSRLTSLVKKLSLQKNVIFESWQDDLVSYYKTANMFLVTSEYEGYGLSMVEAIAAHCLTVATDVGIAPDLLHDGEVSFVCPVGDATCLFDNIKMLIEDTPLRERFVHEAFDRLDKITFQNKSEYLAKYKENIESTLFVRLASNIS